MLSSISIRSRMLYEMRRSPDVIERSFSISGQLQPKVHHSISVPATGPGTTISLSIASITVGRENMLWWIVAAFFILWILGLAGVYSIGGWVWVLCAIWVVFLVVKLAARRSATQKT